MSCADTDFLPVLETLAQNEKSLQGVSHKGSKKTSNYSYAKVNNIRNFNIENVVEKSIQNVKIDRLSILENIFGEPL